MKKIKIVLTILVVALICLGIFLGIQRIEPIEEEKPPENQFIQKIEQDIAEIRSKSDNKFCGDYYREVSHRINEFSKPLPPSFPYGRYGSTKLENDQWKEDLEKTLYSVYAEKFIKQAKSVFRGSAWRKEDLKFIQSEKSMLKKSKWLMAESPIDKDFTTIQTTLNKYYEVVNLISSCNNYNFLSTELSVRFPIGDVQSKISRASILQQNRLENAYVNNCIRLHEGLKEVPEKLFLANIRYLDNKISYWTDSYPNYNSYNDYSNNLYKPLKAEIESLDIGIYSVGNFEMEYNRLLKKWSSDNRNAWDHKF